MLKASVIIAKKDIHLLLIKSGGLVQSLFLGLILIFLFSLSRGPQELISGQSAATIFWMASVFCLVINANMAYGLEEHNNTRAALALIPAPKQSIFLAKFLAILLILLITQVFFLGASIVFLNQKLGANIIFSLCSIILVDIGLASLGSLLGALSGGQSSRDSLLSLILFPLLIPLLLGGIKLLELLFSELELGINWLSLVLSFDAIFLALGLILFPFIYGGED